MAKKFDGMAALHGKLARIKILGRMVFNCQSFVLLSLFVLTKCLGKCTLLQCICVMSDHLRQNKFY